MGDLIVFKPMRGGARVGAAPIDHGTVVVFTGVWQERHSDEDGETKRARPFREGKRGKAAASGAAVRKNKVLSIPSDLLDRADDRRDARFRIRPVALIGGQGADDHKSLRFRRDEPQVLRWIVFVVLGLDDFQLCGG